MQVVFLNNNIYIVCKQTSYAYSNGLIASVFVDDEVLRATQNIWLTF